MPSNLLPWNGWKGSITACCWSRSGISLRGADELGDDLDHVFTDLLHPEERATVIESIRRRFQEEGGHVSEFRMRTKVGGYRWIFARGRVIERDTEGRPTRAIGTHVDITARKDAEAALQALSNYSRRLIETSLDPLVTISPEGLIQDVNRAAERVTGCPREQLIGSDFSSYFTEPDQARAGYQKVFAEGFVTDYPLAIRHADGHITDVFYNASVYRNDAGEVAGVFAAARDVTARKRAEAAVRELNASLEQKVAERTAQLAEAKAAAEAAARSKGEFLANMSHEIRTPMNAVLGLTQILEREPLTPDQHDLLRKISDAGNGLLHVINDILDFSKIEAGQLMVERLPFDLPPVLSQLESLMMGSAESKGLGLRIAPPVDLTGPIIGDPLRLKQILLNLVSNAIKFTDRGVVTVRVLPLELTEIAARLRFEVSDTGIGIGPEALSRLFQPFTQADASTTRRFGGTGLGLSICKRLVELMGGTIGATSEPGAGSTFWFELPCERSAGALVAEAPATSAADGRATPGAGPRLKGLRVLGVDDNRVNLFLLERALKLEGASVQLAADGQQALQILEADPRAFDCVLMDVQMPVMDGLTATQRIREQVELRNLPVIALTAGVMPEERKRVLVAGVNDILAKPLVLENMVAMLRPYLPAER